MEELRTCSAWYTAPPQRGHSVREGATKRVPPGIVRDIGEDTGLALVKPVYPGANSTARVRVGNELGETESREGRF